MTASTLTQRIKDEAGRLGFGLVGVCPAVPPDGFPRLQRWIDAGYAGQMRYLPDRLEAYRHPAQILDGVRSLVMLGMHYRTAEPPQPQAGQGRVSRYAWGAEDYHHLIRRRLKQLRAALRSWAPAARARGVVDTAPLLEREFARLAGLGWIGKNTMLINRRTGSWFFLASLLTDIELEYDAPHETDHCGTCRACLDACPTRAFPEPYVLDATRCISYLTIEHRGDAAEKTREHRGDWLFGCDVCQEVCPWNRRAPRSSEEAFQPLASLHPAALAELFALTEAEFHQRFRETPLARAERNGLLRNAAVVLGNQRSAAALGGLLRGLEDEVPSVRGACAWALGQMGDPRAAAALRSRLAREVDPQVRDEASAALRRVS